MGHMCPDFGEDTVVVTGGSSGIGREVALRFARAGATVVNGDVREEPKDGNYPTHELITDAGGTATYVETDVSEVPDIEELVESAREYGGVDVMVNNAAVATSGPFLEITPEQFDEIHRVNARGVYFGTQVAANDMLDRDDPGVVVNTASISSNVAQFGQTHYDSTKGAIRMITRGTALELSDYGIRVNAVAPGQIATEFAEGWTQQAHEMLENDEFIKPIPLGRVGYPEDVAGGVLFLASEEADYITGQVVGVTGGIDLFTF